MGFTAIVEEEAAELDHRLDVGEKRAVAADAQNMALHDRKHGDDMDSNGGE